MVKRVSRFGIIYFLIAMLFAAGAISKTISNDSTVLAVQWFCAFAFLVLGIMQFRKNASSMTGK